MKKDILKLTKYYAKNFSELSIDNYKDIKKIISKKIVFSDPFHKTFKYGVKAISKIAIKISEKI